MASTERAPRRYHLELAAAFLLYFAALFGRIPALKAVDDPVLAKAIMLSPILPILLMAFAVYRFYRRMDEYHRIRMLKVAAISCGLTGIAAASWSFLTDVGVPPLANYGVLLLLAGVFSVVSFLWRAEDAAAEGKIGRLTRILSWLAAILVAVGGTWLALACLLGLPQFGPLVLAIPGATIMMCVTLHLGPSAGIA